MTRFKRNSWIELKSNIRKNSRYDEVSKTKMKKLEEDYSTVKESQLRETSRKRTISKSTSGTLEKKTINYDELFKKQKDFLKEKKKKLQKIAV